MELLPALGLGEDLCRHVMARLEQTHFHCWYKVNYFFSEADVSKCIVIGTEKFNSQFSALMVQKGYLRIPFEPDVNAKQRLEARRDCNFSTWSEYCDTDLNHHDEKVVIVNEALLPTAIILHDYEHLSDFGRSIIVGGTQFSERMDNVHAIVHNYLRGYSTLAPLLDCLREAQQHKYDNVVRAVYNEYLKPEDMAKIISP